MPFVPPEQDISFALVHLAQIDQLEALQMFESYDPELLNPILNEAGKFAAEMLAPLNQIGDKQGVRLLGNEVKTPEGFCEAYQAFSEAGWMGLSFPEAYGGQGLPKVLALAVMEMLHAANMALALCPMLSFAAIEAILEHGTEDQKNLYLPRLISGEWTGTMNLTEPQAGSDVGALKTRAVPNGDGSYAISGQKIFHIVGRFTIWQTILSTSCLPGCRIRFLDQRVSRCFCAQKKKCMKTEPPAR